MSVSPVDNEPSERVAIILSLMDAWRRHDVESVLAPMAQDVLWHYHVGSKPTRGREAMGRFLERLASHQLELNWKLVRVAETDGAVLGDTLPDFLQELVDRPAQL
jgi:limonene-1,2-epoxide hydrolase